MDGGVYRAFVKRCLCLVVLARKCTQNIFSPAHFFFWAYFSPIGEAGHGKGRTETGSCRDSEARVRLLRVLQQDFGCLCQCLGRLPAALPRLRSWACLSIRFPPPPTTWRGGSRRSRPRTCQRMILPCFFRTSVACPVCFRKSVRRCAPRGGIRRFMTVFFTRVFVALLQASTERPPATTRRLCHGHGARHHAVHAPGGAGFKQSCASSSGGATWLQLVFLSLQGRRRHWLTSSPTTFSIRALRPWYGGSRGCSVKIDSNAERRLTQKSAIPRAAQADGEKVLGVEWLADVLVAKVGSENAFRTEQYTCCLLPWKMVTCGCPNFQSVGGYCKHLRAALL